MRGMATKKFKRGQAVMVQGWGRGTVVNDSEGRNSVNVRGQNWAHLGGPMAFPVEWVKPVCRGCCQTRDRVDEAGYCGSCHARDSYEREVL